MSLDSSLLIFLGAGLAGGLLLGLIGVGMALVAVPLLTFALPRFGVPAEVAPLTAVATSMGVVAVSSVASAIAHQRLGNVNWWLAKVIIPFGWSACCPEASWLPTFPPRCCVGSLQLS